TGASKCIIEDLREEFARDFIFPMFQAGAIYENQYLLGTSIARPLIAKRMVEIARAEKANAIAHGATGKGNDQVRFELAAAALAPDLRVIAPWRDERFRKQFPGRAEMIAFAKTNGISVEASGEKPYSMDRNLLHISYESGVLEEPRRLRDAGWRDFAFRASANGNADDGPGSDAPARQSDSEIQPAGLQRLLVFARTRSAAGARHRNATRRDRRRSSQTLQRQHHRRRPQKPEE